MPRLMAARDAKMVELRRAGFTLETIGARFRITRERARQILEREWPGNGEAVREKRREEARLAEEQAERERFERDARPCAVCGDLTLRQQDRDTQKRHFICEKKACRATPHTSRWRFDNVPGAREKHRRNCIAWQKAHPGRVREIRRLSSARWIWRNRARHTPAMAVRAKRIILEAGEPLPKPIKRRPKWTIVAAGVGR